MEWLDIFLFGFGIPVALLLAYLRVRAGYGYTAGALESLADTVGRLKVDRAMQQVEKANQALQNGALALSCGEERRGALSAGPERGALSEDGGDH